ncbi:MAG: class I SAM-dependent methyltransferase [Planctomycetota bacterium]
MDVVYFFRHSNKLSEFKIQYSLRSVSANFHQVRKVWIFGDRPAFLSADRNLVEHVPWEAISWLKPVNVPVPNFFQQCFRLARYPEVGFEFLLFNENNVLLSPLSEEVAKRNRYLQDMADVRSLETGLWKEPLWRTYDWLRRRGYPGYNFEAGTPLFLTKKRVFEAYRDLSDFVAEDRDVGLLGRTGILNHAFKFERFPLTHQVQEDLCVGFQQEPAIYDDIVVKSNAKQFLTFDDEAFTDDMRRFLAEQFPEPCQYEHRDRKASAVSPATIVLQPQTPSASLATTVSTPHSVTAFKQQVGFGVGHAIQSTLQVFSRIGLERNVQVAFDWSANDIVAMPAEDFYWSVGPKQIEAFELACRLLNVRITRAMPAAIGTSSSVDELSHAESGCVDLAATFTTIFRDNSWGSSESVSGGGSTHLQTENLREVLPTLLAGLGVQCLLDTPCGDYNWMRHVNLGAIRYLGADIVEQLIQQNQERFGSERVTFVQKDVLSDEIPAVDLILSRDCLVHFPYSGIRQALQNFCRSRSQWLLTTTFPGRRSSGDIEFGQWRPINLELEPFSLPPPVALIIERCTEGKGGYADKSLGLWHLRDIEQALGFDRL